MRQKNSKLFFFIFSLLFALLVWEWAIGSRRHFVLHNVVVVAPNLPNGHLALLSS